MSQRDLANARPFDPDDPPKFNEWVRVDLSDEVLQDKNRKTNRFPVVIVLVLVVAMLSAAYSMRHGFSGLIHRPFSPLFPTTHTETGKSGGSPVPKIFVNGKPIGLGSGDVKLSAPGVVLVPASTFRQAVSADVVYDSAGRRIVVSKGADSIIMTIDSNMGTVNGKIVKLPSPRLFGGKPYVPFLIVSKALGYEPDELTSSKLKIDLVEIKAARRIMSDIVAKSKKDSSSWRMRYGA